jgi:hypothetical protein
VEWLLLVLLSGPELEPELELVAVTACVPLYFQWPGNVDTLLASNTGGG